MARLTVTDAWQTREGGKKFIVGTLSVATGSPTWDDFRVPWAGRVYGFRAKAINALSEFQFEENVDATGADAPGYVRIKGDQAGVGCTFLVQAT